MSPSPPRLLSSPLLLALLMCLPLWDVLAAGSSRRGRQLQETKAAAAAAQAPVTRKADVIIIGAGLAGASAARQVADKMGAKSVIVLEGRNRIGGRTWTQQLTGKGGAKVNAELGAGWVHGLAGNPIVGLATAANVSLAKRPTDYDNGQLYMPNGSEASDAQEASWEAVWEQFEESVAQQQEELEGSSDPGLGAVAQDFIRRRKLGGLNRLAFLSALNTNIEHEYSGPASQLSLFFDSESELKGGDKLVTGGYQRLAEWLLRGLDVRGGHKVTAIDSSTPTAITLTTNRGTFTAGQVVVAVPLGVLQRNAIRFLPSGLPAGNRKAMGQLGVGLLNKLVMVFDRVWWDARLEVMNRIAPQGDGAWSEIYSLAPVTGQPERSSTLPSMPPRWRSGGRQLSRTSACACCAPCLVPPVCQSP